MSTHDLRSALIGSWRLISLEAITTNGDISHPLGENPLGIVMYTPDGYMSAQVRREDADMTGYIAYSGPFFINGDGTIIEHEVAVSFDPSWLGSRQVRRVRIDGDLLYLSTEKPVLYNGQLVTPHLVWKRNQLNP
jgi:hypothetical protein